MVDDMMHCIDLMCRRGWQLLEGQVQLQGWMAPGFPSCLNILGKDKMSGGAVVVGVVVLTRRRRGLVR